MTALNITHRDPKTLTPHPRNARRHSDKQKQQLAQSITSLGFNVPVLVDDSGQILAGHCRTDVAIALGLTSIPTVCIEHLSEGQARAFMIADNRLGDLSDFDEGVLALELEELLSLDEPFEITDTGFEMARVDALIEDLHKPEAQDDPADASVDPSRVEKVARPGDVWLVGDHRLFVGNALEPESYKVLLGGERAQMIFIDPPYNVPISGHVSGLGKVKHPEFVMGSSEMSPAQFRQFLRTAFEHLIAFSQDGAIHYVAMDWRGLQAVLEAGEVYTELKNICVWVKAQGGMGSLYRSQHEFVVVLKSGKAAHINNVSLGRHGRTRTNVWTMPGMNSFQKGRAEKLAMHPTVKPVGLIADAILDCSSRGGLILDVFGGVATTLIAAHRTGRRAAIMELDPHYVDVALRRICDVTGIEPFNAATGQIVRRRER